MTGIIILLIVGALFTVTALAVGLLAWGTLQALKALAKGS